VSEVNLLDRYPRSKRPIAQREASVPRERDVARRFAREYFDGDRTQGYGGYRYDGRWVPVAQRFREYYALTSGQRILDVGCAKGFLMHDLRHLAPDVQVYGLDLSTYALENAMSDVRPYCARGTADALPYSDDFFDLVISINTVHNLDLERCKQALREMTRVSRKHAYVQVDSWLTDEQRDNFERWQLTALTYFDPDGWRQLFEEVGYAGDYYWTITE
jgi:cyclopropane fatty-acyl-phospholipid synthase-like methyltransferase